jgi:hypothetical protein
MREVAKLKSYLRWHVMRSTITLSYPQKSAPKRLFIQLYIPPVCFRAFGWTGAGSHLVLKEADISRRIYLLV